jgi:hypothetical protein
VLKRGCNAYLKYDNYLKLNNQHKLGGHVGPYNEHKDILFDDE